MTYVDVHNNKVTYGNNNEHKETYHNERLIMHFKFTIHTHQKISCMAMLTHGWLHHFTTIPNGQGGKAKQIHSLTKKTRHSAYTAGEYDESLRLLFRQIFAGSSP